MTNPFFLVLGILLGIVLLIILFNLFQFFTKGRFQARIRLSSEQQDNLKELVLRKFLLRKVQSLHLGADLFPLSSIYIEQKLLSHPYFADYNENLEEEPLFFRQAISISDAPDLAAGYPLPTLSLEEAISKNKNIAVSGQIGTGKTTCLAHLVSNILEEKCGLPQINEFFPIYIHIRQILNQSRFETMKEKIAHALYDEIGELEPPDITRIFEKYNGRSRLILVIDGLDELTPELFQSSIDLISNYHNNFPQTRIIATTGPFYSDGIQQAGFTVLPIKLPEQADGQALINQWLQAWLSAGKSTTSTSDQLLSLWLQKRWLWQLNQGLSYGELTLILYSVLQREVIPPNNPIISYLNITTNNTIDKTTILSCANLMFDNSDYGCNMNRIIEELNKSTVENNQENTHTSKEIIDLLISRKIFTRISDQIYFCNPLVFCTLLASQEALQTDIEIQRLKRNPVHNLVVFLNGGIKSEHLLLWLQNYRPSDKSTFSFLLSHLFNARNPVPNLSPVLQNLAVLITSPQTPLSEKIKYSSVIYYAKPAVFSQLLSKLEQQKTADFKKLCAFFYGFLPSEDHFDYLINCVTGPDPSVRLFGINAMINLANEDIKSSLKSILQSSQDDKGRMVAEMLSQNAHFGHPLLKELIHDEHSICRRNVIFGLRLIHESWSDQLLENIIKNDKIWIVRDAAAHALQNKLDPMNYAPHPMVSPSENQRLLKIASARGHGIPAKEFPFEFLSLLCAEGSYEERLLAVQYLSKQQTEQSLNLIKSLTRADNPVREIAQQAILEYDFQH